MKSLVLRSGLTIALPLAACLVLGALLGLEWHAQRAQAERTATRTELQILLGRSVHALQLERGLSTALVSGVDVFAQRLPAARMDTDRLAREVEQRLSDPEDYGRRRIGQALLSSAREALSRLPEVRRAVDAGRPDPLDVLKQYTIFITRLIELTEPLGSAATSPELVNELEVYQRLMIYKERASRERGFGAALLADRGADEKVFDLYRRAVILREEALREIALAGPGTANRRAYEAVADAPYKEELEGLRSRLERLAQIGETDEEAAVAWFDAATRRKDYLQDILDSQANEIGETATRLERSAKARFVGLVSLFGVLLVVLAWVTNHLSRQLVVHLEAEQRHAQRVRHLARHDLLTDLPNRYYFEELLDEARQRASRQKKLLALHLVDLVDFSQVNRVWGNQAGDGVLKTVARRLQERMGREGSVGRLYGDQFGAIQPLSGGREEAEVLARDLLKEFQRPVEVDTRLIQVRARIGITLYPPDGRSSEALLRNADLARQHVVHGGEFRFYVAEMYERYLASKDIADALRHSVMEDEFSVRYQPKLNLTSNRITGVEALVRWRHPERGILEPDEFMREAETSGAIVGIGSYVFEQACSQVRAWLTAGLEPPIMSVNLSAVQLKQADLVEGLAKTLERTGVEARYVELEITESVLMEDSPDTLNTLQSLRRLGVHLAIDDFGTGHSSLTYLLRFPVNTLKIDQSFIADLKVSRESEVIVEAVIRLARSLDLHVVAEGVESRVQLEILREKGCDEVQGYLVARPLSAEEMTRMLERQGAA